MKFEHDDILIIGDSFCRTRDIVDSWPYIVHNKLTGIEGTPRGYGFSGCAWWSVRQLLLQEIAICKPKVLILCHTEPNRIPNELNAGMNFTSIEKDAVFATNIPIDPVKLQKLTKAGKLYYEELFMFEFQRWAELAWFRELDHLLDDYKIPHVVHLHCFNNDYVFRNGHTYTKILSNMCSNGPSYRGINHFTPEENQYLGQGVTSIILDN